MGGAFGRGDRSRGFNGGGFTDFQQADAGEIELKPAKKKRKKRKKKKRKLKKKRSRTDESELGLLENGLNAMRN